MSVATEQVPGVYRRRVGGVVVTALYDGTVTIPWEARQGMPPAQQEALLRAAGVRPPYAGVINVFMLQMGSKTVLVDTGVGPLMGPAAGRMLGNLRAAGVSPEEVDAILLTHLHIDHVGGLLSMEGAPVFPRAELYVSDVEMAYWYDDAAKASRPEFQQRGFDLARRNTAAYASQTHRFAFQEGEVMPGVQAVPLPGHTPGMTGFIVSDSGESLLIWGDAVNIPAIQAPHPEVFLVFDSDPEMGIATRRKILERATEEDLLVTGMHISFPGFSHVGQDGDGFRILPEPWAMFG